MEFDQARRFLSEHNRAVLHTYRGDGSPQLSPVLVTVDDEGDVLISTRETSMKVTNLERDPRASICAFTDGFFGPWVRVDGSASIERLPGALESLVDYYRRVAGEHDDWAAYREAMQEERRVLVRITPQAAGPDASG